jgi:hypothetical protein
MIANAARECDGVDQTAGDDEKQGMNNALPMNPTFSFEEVCSTAPFTASPARKAPTMPGRLITSATAPVTAMMPSITTKWASSDDNPALLLRFVVE